MSASTARGPAVTIHTFAQRKTTGEPIVMITAYDAPSARAAEAAGVDAVLVGDSLGMTVLGYENTLAVTLDDMVRHTAAVARVARDTFIVADMPFGSYQASPDDAVTNAVRLVAEGGAHAVKIEGGRAAAPLVRRIVDAGIPVMGHVGFTPQSVHAFGGYTVQGKDVVSARRLVRDALELDRAGAFAIVLELVPAELAALITRRVRAATIGIGAGVGCDGQVQVFHDLVGLGTFTPRHAKRYVDVGALITEALTSYAADVRARVFPGEDHLTHASQDVIASVEQELAALAGED